MPAESNVIERLVSPRKVAWSKLQALNASVQSKGAHEAIPEKCTPKKNMHRRIGIQQKEECIFFPSKICSSGLRCESKVGNTQRKLWSNAEGDRAKF